MEGRLKSIAIFNNKGGVGKTTFLANLAANLALEGNKSVLIVDADPQCNITQMLFNDVETESLYEEPKTFTIYDIIHPLSIGKGYNSKLEVMDRPHFGVDILIGDPKLSLKEDLLARDWSQALGGDERGLRTSYLFAELLTRCQNYDYVFFDVGPSLGSINRSVLLACDYFISPMTIDIFSLKAVENICISLETWRKQIKTAIANVEDKKSLPKFVTKNFNIKFAGYITQQYKAKTDAAGDQVAVKAYEKIMKRVKPVIRENFVKKLQPSYDAIDYQIGTIPNLYSLIPMSQFARRPIFKLRSSDGVRGAHFTKVREAGDLFLEIAEKFENNLEALN